MILKRNENTGKRIQFLKIPNKVTIICHFILQFLKLIKLRLQYLLRVSIFLYKVIKACPFKRSIILFYKIKSIALFIKLIAVPILFGVSIFLNCIQRFLVYTGIPGMAIKDAETKYIRRRCYKHFWTPSLGV